MYIRAMKIARPLNMYHITSDGENYSNLNSFLKHGVQIPNSGWTKDTLQRNGFFVSSSRASSLRKATDIGQIVGHHSGNPVLITVECDFSQEWDLDYEESPKLAKRILFNFRDQLANVGAGEIILPGGSQIQSMTPIYTDDTDGLDIVFVKPNQETSSVYLGWDTDIYEDLRKNLGHLTRESFFDAAMKARKNMQINQTELLQVLRDYLVNVCGDEYTTYESNEIRNAINLSNVRELKSKFDDGISLKYTGSTNLPIVKIERSDELGSWRQIKDITDVIVKLSGQEPQDFIP